MQYTTLGNTGLQISKLCLGCMSFGDASRGFQSGWLLNEADSRAVIKKALESGINFFDTANIYGFGSSEEYLGRAIADFAKRDEVVISTKVFFGDSVFGKDAQPAPNTTGLSRKAIFHQVETSLKRLGTDYIDILYIHRWDYRTPIAETMSALNDLVRAGKVRYLGASAMYAWQFQQAQHSAEQNGWEKFCAMQNHYNLIYREEEREMIPLCKATGVGLTPYSPLAAGRLVRDWDAGTARSQSDDVNKGKYDSTREQDFPIVQRVAQLAATYGKTRAQIALAWLWQKGVDSPIMGVTREKYLDDFLGAFDVQLSDEDMDYLEALYQPHRVVGAL